MVNGRYLLNSYYRSTYFQHVIAENNVVEIILNGTNMIFYKLLNNT